MTLTVLLLVSCFLQLAEIARSDAITLDCRPRKIAFGITVGKTRHDCVERPSPDYYCTAPVAFAAWKCVNMYKRSSPFRVDHLSTQGRVAKCHVNCVRGGQCANSGGSGNQGSTGGGGGGGDVGADCPIAIQSDTQELSPGGC